MAQDACQLLLGNWHHQAATQDSGKDVMGHNWVFGEGVAQQLRLGRIKCEPTSFLRLWREASPRSLMTAGLARSLFRTSRAPSICAARDFDVLKNDKERVCLHLLRSGRGRTTEWSLPRDTKLTTFELPTCDPYLDHQMTTSFLAGHAAAGQAGAPRPPHHVRAGA